MFIQYVDASKSICQCMANNTKDPDIEFPYTSYHQCPATVYCPAMASSPIAEYLLALFTLKCCMW